MRLPRSLRVGFAVLLVPALARAVPTIPDVRTLADLRRVPPIATDIGYDVRLGIADPGPDAGPYKLVYCLAEARPGATTRPADGGGQYALGPLWVDVVNVHAKVQRLAEDRAGHRSGPGPWLYCQSVPVDWADDLTVRVSAGQTVIADRPLGKSDHRPLFWSRFAVPPKGAFDTVSVDPDPRPACPAFDGTSSLLWSATEEEPPLPADAELLPGGDPLPPAWRRFYFGPDDHGGAVTLTLDHDGGRLVVSGSGRPRFELSTAHLLARWWVNGKPVDLTDTPAAKATLGLERVPRRQFPLPVRFGLPAALGPVKAGDTVGVQVMWADHVEDVSTGRQLLARATKQVALSSRPASPVPIVSGRVDVTLDAKLLSVAGR